MLVRKIDPAQAMMGDLLIWTNGAEVSPYQGATLTHDPSGGPIWWARLTGPGLLWPNAPDHVLRPAPPTDPTTYEL